jgi:DNA mismatch repair protein MutL
VVQRSLALDEPTTSAAPGAAFAPVTGAGPRGGGGAGARAWAERLRAELSAARAKAGPAGPSAAEVLALDAVDGAANDRGRAGHDAAGDDGEGDGAGRGRGRDEDAGASWADAHPRGVVQPGYFAGLRYLGQLDLTYLVCEGDGELVLIDQHAAHERVELARLRARAPHDVPTQRLLFPATIDATPAQLALVEELAPVLARVGFEAEPFGKATIAIKAVPAGLRDEEPAALLGRVLGEWAATGAAGVDARLDAMLATIACHSVVRAGDRLAVGEIEVLLRGMDGADQDALGPLGPHGRPVLMRLALAEIGRRFGR